MIRYSLSHMLAELYCVKMSLQHKNKRRQGVCVSFLLLLILFSAGCEKGERFPDIQSPTMDLSFTIRDTMIGGSVPFQMSYRDAVSLFGAPISIEERMVQSSAADEYGFPVSIVCFPSIQCEFFCSQTIDGSIPENAQIVRYDITGPEYPFLGIQVGMSIEEIEKLLQPLDLEETSVLRASTEELEQSRPTECLRLIEAKKVLFDDKSEEYTAENDSFCFLKNRLTKSDIKLYPDGMPLSLGAVLLFSDGVLTRIAFGFPTAN